MCGSLSGFAGSTKEGDFVGLIGDGENASVFFRKRRCCWVVASA